MLRFYERIVTIGVHCFKNGIQLFDLLILIMKVGAKSFPRPASE